MYDIQQIVGPSVWRGSDFSGKRDITVGLGRDELAAIDRALRTTQGLEMEAIEPRHFSDPVLERFMERVGEEVLRGRGLVVLGGFPVDKYDQETVSRIFWGLGRLLGCPVSQSVMGERLGHIVNKADEQPNSRGYRHHYELTPHTDFHEIVTFMCLQQGRKGGISWYVSSHTLHNLLLQSRPDLLETLYRGFYTHRFGENGVDEASITEHRVPLFSRCEDQVSCRFLRRYIELAAHEGEALTDQEREALDAFDRLSMDTDNGFFFTLEPGEAVLMNNYVVLHGRTAFEDGDVPGAKRHLIRLWLTVDQPRPVAPELYVYASEVRGEGIAPQTGRLPVYDDSETVKRVYSDRMPEL